MTSDLALLLRSLPYLRPTQPLQRAKRLLSERLTLRERSVDAPPDFEPLDLDRGYRRTVARPSLNGDRFESVGYSAPIGWNDPDAPRLWQFHLHGFRFAYESPALVARMFHDWIRQHPPRRGDPWHPFVIAERLINLLSTARHWLSHSPDPMLAIKSLWSQYRVLGRVLEHDIGGNHLLRELAAMTLAERSFGRPPHSANRLAVAAGRQILPDGTHYERSASYHLEVLGDLYDSWLCTGHEGLRQLVERMVAFARGFVHPDGTSPAFNDCSSAGPAAGHVLDALGLEGAGETSFPFAGYDRLGDCLLMDCGDPSPRDLPAHAHCDLLSIEISVGGRRFIVNSGTGDYERGAWRDYWRSTRAHNTIEVDHSEQSEVWGSFRMARRARPMDVRRTPSSVSASHDGYAAHGVVHRRTVELESRGWTITDELTGSGTHHLRSFLHLHPAVVVEGSRLKRDGAACEVVGEGLPVSLANATSDPIENWYAPSLGYRERAQALVMAGEVSLPAVLRWRVVTV